MVKRSRMQKRMENNVENKPVTDVETEVLETEDGAAETVA